MAVTSVASAASSTALLSPNGTRDGMIVTNTDANILYVLLDNGTASTANHSFQLAQNASSVIYGWRGAVTGIWAGDGSGVALLTTW